MTSWSIELDLHIELITRAVAIMHRLTVELSCLHQNSYYLEAALSNTLLPHDRVDHADHVSVISGKNHITRVVNFMHPRVRATAV